MHTRRISTFLLGAWIAGCLFIAFVSVQNLRTPSLVLNTPLDPVAKMMQQIGWEQISALLRHAAAEQTRHYTALWIDAQFLLSLLLLGCLAMATQKRILPLALCGMMIVVVLFQFRIWPEMIYQGRATDFPPGSNQVGEMTRYWALQQVYFGAEIIKLLCGGVLGSYLFVFHTRHREATDKRAVSLSR